MRSRPLAVAILASLLLAPSLAFASKPITVQQFDSIVTEAHSSHQSDDALTRQLTDVRLTERLTGDHLQKLIALSPGPKTTQALNAIAGMSAFLDPPSSQLSSTPPPNLATQKALMARTVNYVLHTLPALPNFLATRLTRQYVDNLRGVALQAERRGDLYWIGDHHAPIAFRDGRESDDPALTANTSPSRKGHADASDHAASDRPVQGMTSWGEFGPVLGLVILDAAKSKLAWQRWETQNGKPVAVFQFSVPRAASHYQLNYCCSNPSTADYGYVTPPDEAPVVIKPGYHGGIEVDPETGNILRLTIEADLKPGDAISRAFMMVEYGPVKIGEEIRFCPIRSVSLSQSHTMYATNDDIRHTDRLLLNDVEFTNYHRFGSESTLLIASGDDKSANPGATPLEADSAPAPAAPDVNPAETAKATPEPAPAPLPPPPTTDPEISIHPAASLPGMDADPASSNTAANSSEASFTLKATTRLVDLGLVATDKHGKPLIDLKPDEIEIYDNGRKQQIAAFHHRSAAAGTAAAVPEVVSEVAPEIVTPAAPPSGPRVFTNATLTQANQDAPDLLILLIDESHLGLNDLNQAHGEMLRFLKATRPDARVALYSIGDYGFRVIQDVTQDHVLMIAKLTAWVPSASAVALSQKLDQRERQQSENLQDAQNLHGLNVQAHGDIQAAVPLGDPDLRTIGNNPLRLALEGMTALARHFASVPGHKSLAWISGDRALAGLSPAFANSEAGKRSNQQLESAISHTREALNDAHIALYVVDASNPTLIGGGVDPSRYGPGPETSPAATSNQVPGGAPKAPLGDGSGAQMQLNLSGIQGPLRNLAQATGGRAINRGDLGKALAGIEDDGRALYEVSFGPDTPPDGKFHTLELKVLNRKDVKLRYRTGYEYSEESGNTQQRFQQAVWSPLDASAIRLTAEVAAATESPSGAPILKLRVAFPGLALEQRDSRWKDQLYIFVAQRDDATQKAEVSGDTMRLALRQATYDSGMPDGIPYQRAVELKSKLGSVRVIVVDGNSGRMGSVTLPSSALHP